MPFTSELFRWPVCLCGQHVEVLGDTPSAQAPGATVGMVNYYELVEGRCDMTSLYTVCVQLHLISFV